MYLVLLLSSVGKSICFICETFIKGNVFLYYMVSNENETISKTKSDINKILLKLNLNCFNINKELENILKMDSSKKKLSLLKQYMQIYKYLIVFILQYGNKAISGYTRH